jgi:glycosyltransferase involved in cell wall biosynthesis
MKNTKSFFPTIDDYSNALLVQSKITGGSRLYGTKGCSKFPLVTVFTIVRNASDLLPPTIFSVTNQTYENIEYIVVDGGSQDGTLDVLRRFDSRINLWISEPDSGTSDATNKAVALSSGQFVFWLSAGDTIPNDYISKSVSALQKSGADFVYGCVTYFDGTNKKYVAAGEKQINGSKKYIPTLNYATWVMRKELFEKNGGLDFKYKYVNDLEWGLRIRRNSARGYYEPTLNVNYLLGGITSNTFLPIEIEIFKVLRQYGTPLIPACLVFCHRVVKTQFRVILSLILPTTVYEKIITFFREKHS